MKVTVVQANKFKSSLGCVILFFALTGCANGVGQVGVMTKCRQAEVAVDAAQKEYSDAVLNLQKNPTDLQAKKAIPAKTQNLQDAEEKAFEMCNRVK